MLWLKKDSRLTSENFLCFFNGSKLNNFMFLNIIGYAIFKDSIQLLADICQTIIVVGTLVAFCTEGRFFLRNRVFQLLCLSVLIQICSWLSSKYYINDYALTLPSVKSLAYLFFFIGIAYWLKGEQKKIIIVLLSFCFGVIFTFGYHSNFFSVFATGLEGARVDFSYRNAQHGSLISGACLLFFVTLICNSKTQILGARKISMLCGIIIFCIFSIILQSRQSWLAITMVLAILPFFMDGALGARRNILIIYSILFISIFTLYHVPFVKERLSSGFAHAGDIHAIITGDWNNVQDFSIGVRLKTWLEALKWFMEYPLFGTGFGSQSLVITLSDTLPDYITREFRHLHNSNMETLVCWGVAGFLTLYYTLFYVVRQVLSYPDSSCFIKMLAVSFIIYWLIINNFESFFYMRSGQWVFSVFLGAIYSMALHREIKAFTKERYENLCH
ncbi:O-antigen ligase family protein [Aeromonas salmonicida]|uniref:O-antigen ligase family protein n=1 Tax=Aeromonas salmonicida TaxID=645 RepID=UPI000C1C0966|nr:O-antigen ligase family protein [Aeromonas salmonicida]ATU99750.1 hypothetical protein CHQ57_21610 [Aeromonas salmonicida]